MTQLPDTTTEAGQREASVMLARMCGWVYQHDGITGSWYTGNDVLADTTLLYDEWQRTRQGYDVIDLNLYAPANMALAWRVLNWAMNTNPDMGVSLLLDVYRLDSFECGFVDLPRLKPADAQRAWLDKILTLADSAGMLP